MNVAFDGPYQTPAGLFFDLLTPASIYPFMFDRADPLSFGYGQLPPREAVVGF